MNEPIDSIMADRTVGEFYEYIRKKAKESKSIDEAIQANRTLSIVGMEIIHFAEYLRTGE